MNKLFFLLALRSIFKRRLYSLIEVAGLSMGIGCFIAVVLYVTQQLSYDRHFSNSDKVYRIIHVNEEGKRYSGIPSALGTHLRDEVPQVKEVVRVFWLQRMFSQTVLVQNDSIRFYEAEHLVADSTFFHLFDFHFIEGNAREALGQKEGVVISEAAARKYFGYASALNKSLRIGEQDVVVTGVVRQEQPTHLSFDFLQPVQAYSYLDYSWDYTLSFTYVRVDDERNLKPIEDKAFQLVLQHSKSENAEYLKLYHHLLQPLADVQHDVLDWDIVSPTPLFQIYGSAVVAAFILILALTNFINLSTSRLTERAKGIGINIVVGADRRSLYGQVLIEYSILVFVSLLMALVLLIAFQPVIEDILGTTINLSNLLAPKMIIALILLLAGVVILSGIYPIVHLSSIKAATVIKRTSTSSPAEHTVRKVLTIFQFMVAGSLVTSTLIVHSQLQFLRETDMGIDQEGVLVMRFRHPDKSRFKSIREQLQQNRNVAQIAGASSTIGLSPGSTTFHPDHMPEQTGETFASTLQVDEHFLSLMKIPIVQGRNLDGESRANHGTAYIVNETALKQFRLDDPIGARFIRQGDAEGEIIGVVKDFYFGSAAQKIGALVINYDSVQSYNYMLVKITSDLPNTVSYIQQVWDRLMPEYPFEYSFQDQFIARMYAREEEAKHQSQAFAAIAILIATLGLFALSSFISLKRTREMSIRKVSGASGEQIFLLLTSDLVRLIMLGVILAVPITWWAMSGWLQTFTNHIELHPYYFLLTALATCAIALVTTSFHALKAARINPAKTLRNE